MGAAAALAASGDLARAISPGSLRVVERISNAFEFLPHDIGNGEARPFQRLQNPLRFANPANGRCYAWIPHGKLQRYGAWRRPMLSADGFNTPDGIEQLGGRLLIDVARISA